MDKRDYEMKDKSGAQTPQASAPIEMRELRSALAPASAARLSIEIDDPIGADMSVGASPSTPRHATYGADVEPDR